MSVSANQLITARNMRARQGIPVAASKHIYQGALVFRASGYATDVVNTGSNTFAGVAVAEADNSSGNNGDVTAEVYQEGVFTLVGSGFSQSSVGSLCYASDNYTVTATSTNNTKIGRIVGYIDSTHVEVLIDVQQA